MAPVHGSDFLGERLGSYRLAEKIAEGGMGTVYRAVRADGAFEQTVAIKMLRQALPSESALERFRQERRLLSQLDHPHIARLLDAGTTGRGAPYLVMEYVCGEPIDRYCAGQAIDLNKRLELFCKVCSAVGEAHRNLIVHRDLKASNILVTAEGMPKLLDFGIAKALDTGTLEQTPQTGDMSRLMTPEFASPEQIRGEAVTTASDVYALGALLYQLLTGEYPFARWRSDPLHLQNAICNENPTLPSQLLRGRGGAQAGLRARQLAGDLDAIVTKALRKEPRHRYAGALDVADDIHRYLRREPIAARRGNRRYHAQKYIQRHARALSLTFMIFGGIALLVTVYTNQIRAEQQQAETQRVRAERGWQSADAISEFIASLFWRTHTQQQRERSPGRTAKPVTANQLLNVGFQRLGYSLPGQPLVMARLMMVMARAQLAIGKGVHARELFQQALELRQKHLDPGDPRLTDSMEEYGLALVAGGQFFKAQSLLDSVARSMQQRHGETSVEYALSLLRAADAHLYAPKPSGQTRERIEMALQIFLAQEQPDLVAVALAYGELSRWHHLHQQYSESLQWVSRKRDAMLSIYAPDDRQMLGVDLELGEALWWAGDTQAAITAVQRGLTLLDRYKGPRHPDSAPGYATLNRAHQSLGNYAAAYEDLSNMRLIAGEPDFYLPKLTATEIQAAWAEYLFAIGLKAMGQQVLETLESIANFTAQEKNALARVEAARRRIDEAAPVIESNTWLNSDQREQLRQAVTAGGYIHKPNCGVPLYNVRALKDVTPDDCKRACTEEKEFYCKTFDYNKLRHTCYLQDMSEADVALKTDYEFDRYDHYHRLGVDDHHAGLPNRLAD